ncbi:MAG TPA: cupin domain-containing protein [Terriglobia bacterium]|nr:cupin domain-containing protein [Terriglobia bacterium]
MERKVFKEVESFSKEKPIHVPIFAGKRTKVLLLCLSGGLTVPPHSHPGFEITLQPLKGKALLPINGEEIVLVPGEILLVDGEISFSPRNPFDETFEMLIHLIER